MSSLEMFKGLMSNIIRIGARNQNKSAILYELERQAKIDKVEQDLKRIEEYDKLEADLGCPLDEAIDLLFEGFETSQLYQCVTCTSIMHNERGCEGNCEHNKKFSKKEILENLKKYITYSKGLRKDKSEQV